MEQVLTNEEAAALLQQLKAAEKAEKAARAHTPVDKIKVLEHTIRSLGVEFSYDEFRKELMVQWPGEDRRPLNDEDEDKVKMHTARNGAILYADLVHACITTAAHENNFHPVREYLETLPAWDGEPRLDSWLIDMAGAQDTPFNRKVGAATLIAAVRRILHPGSKFDEALVLISAEGSGKSSLVQKLSPNPAWVSDSLPISASPKQVIEGTRGVWIVESAELVGAKNVEHVKAFLSRQTDGPVRLAYARNPTSVPRQFIVIGTTNEDRPLRSQTGARRFWPVRVGMSRLPRLEKNRDQLWAEAYVRSEAGEPTFIDSKLYPFAVEAQKNHVEDSPWRMKIEQELITRQFPTLVPILDVWSWVNKDNNRTTADDVASVAQIMKAFMYEKEPNPVMFNGRKCRVFKRELNPFKRPFDTSLSGAPDADLEDLADTLQAEQQAREYAEYIGDPDYDADIVEDLPGNRASEDECEED